MTTGERDKLAAIRKGLEVMNFPGLKATTSNAIRYALDAGIVQLRRDAQTIAEMRKGRDELIPAALLEIADMEGGE